MIVLGEFRKRRTFFTPVILVANYRYKFNTIYKIIKKTISTEKLKF